MRTSILTTAASALAATALVAGAGTAAAEEAGEQRSIRAGLLTPSVGETTGSFGYGSGGTGSLMDLITGVINVGSTTLSVDVPNSVGSTGFYAPGSFGSYGPLVPFGEVLTASVGVIGGSF